MKMNGNLMTKFGNPDNWIKTLFLLELIEKYDISTDE